MGCQQPYHGTPVLSSASDSVIGTLVSHKSPSHDSSDFERQFVRMGFVNIAELDSNIRVVLIYNTDKNFIGKKFYGGLDQCYLPCDVAIKLSNAQKILKQQYPFYNLIVFDASRPLRVQRMMWDSLKMDPNVKFNYLAYPGDLSLHNYGAAVDLSIINENGILLDMGTPFDHFGELAQPKFEQKYLASGELTKEAYRNRLILRNVMLKGGFYKMDTEWWHFNACNKQYAAANYTVIE